MMNKIVWSNTEPKHRGILQRLYTKELDITIEGIHSQTECSREEWLGEVRDNQQTGCKGCKSAAFTLMTTGKPYWLPFC